MSPLKTCLKPGTSEPGPKHCDKRKNINHERMPEERAHDAFASQTPPKLPGPAWTGKVLAWQPDWPDRNQVTPSAPSNPVFKQPSKATGTATATNKQTNKQTNKTNKQTNKQTNTQTNRQTNKQTNTQASKQASKQANKQTTI